MLDVRRFRRFGRVVDQPVGVDVLRIETRHLVLRIQADGSGIFVSRASPVFPLPAGPMRRMTFAAMVPASGGGAQAGTGALAGISFSALSSRQRSAGMVAFAMRTLSSSSATLCAPGIAATTAG